MGTRKEYPGGGSRLMVSDAKQWYEETQSGLLLLGQRNNHLKSAAADLETVNLPLWNKARSTQWRNRSVVEIPVSSNRRISFGKKPDGMVNSTSRLVISNDMETGRMHTIVMTIVVDSAFMHRKDLNRRISKVRMHSVDSEFSGDIRFSNLNGRFLVGYRFKNGEYQAKLLRKDIHKDSAKRKRSSWVCEPIEEMVCEDIRDGEEWTFYCDYKEVGVFCFEDGYDDDDDPGYNDPWEDPCWGGWGDPCDCYGDCGDDDCYDDCSCYGDCGGDYQENDCAGVAGGSAYTDDCVGGTTGLRPCQPCKGIRCPDCGDLIVQPSIKPQGIKGTAVHPTCIPCACIIDPSGLEKDLRVKCVYDRLAETGIMKRHLKNFDGDFPVDHLRFTLNDLRKPNVNAVTGPPQQYWITIELNEGNISGRPSLMVAGTMIHEAIHAEISRKLHSLADKNGEVDRMEVLELQENGDFPGLLDYFSRFGRDRDHVMMAEHYRETIANALQEFDGNAHSRQFYMDLSWEGLNYPESPTWEALPLTEKNRILKVIGDFENGGNKECDHD